MAAIINSDISIAANGNIRWTGAATANRHSVLEFIQYLMDKQDDEQAAGDDLLDITVDTPFDRSTDQIMSLNSPFNIDDTFAAHLYDGSISQIEPTVGGETIYSGLNVIGPVEAGTEYMILQDGKVLSAFWGTGINPEAAPSLVFSRHLVKSKFAGALIDGQRIMVLARELGDQYRRFPVTLGTGNSVAAIGNGADIFNVKSDGTLAGYTSIDNVEGFQEINIDGGGAAGQEFYSQWNIGTQTVNDTYERTKWISQRAHEADSTGGTPTGADFVIDNDSIVGQAQSFIPVSGTEDLTQIVAKIKILAGSPTGPVYCELWDSDDAGTPEPTGGALARSENVLASAITSDYEDVIFRFNQFDPSDGSDQSAVLALGNVEYFAVFRHPDGAVGDNFSLEGASTDQDGTVSQADDTAATWTGSLTDDIYIAVNSSPSIHDIAGERFEGINIEVGFDGEVGTGLAENNLVMWGTLVSYDGLSGGPFFPGEYITFKTGSVLKSGAKVLYDNGTDELLVLLDSPSGSILTDDDVITTLRGGSEATAVIFVTITDDEKSGGTGILLAKDDNGVDGELYLQVVTGSNPIEDNILRRDDVSGDPLADYALATATLGTRTVVPEYLGTSTGSNIIGAYGIGFEALDVGSSDLFISLDNVSRQPPNNVIFTVAGLVSGEDRVLVGPRTGSVLDKGQWVLFTTLQTGSEVEVVVNDGTDTVPWPSNKINWPDSGGAGDPSSLRVELDSGIYKNQDYSSHDGIDTFDIPSTSYSGDIATAGNNVFMAFIDLLATASEETFTGVHSGVDRNLFVRVRDGGTAGDNIPIKTFEGTSAIFKSTAQTVAAIRTVDA